MEKHLTHQLVHHSGCNSHISHCICIKNAKSVFNAFRYIYFFAHRYHENIHLNKTIGGKDFYFHTACREHFIYTNAYTLRTFTTLFP